MVEKEGKGLGKGGKGWERDGETIGKQLENSRKTVGKRVGREGKGLERGWKMEKRVGKGGSAPDPALERTQRLWWDGFSSSSGRELGMALENYPRNCSSHCQGRAGGKRRDPAGIDAGIDGASAPKAESARRAPGRARSEPWDGPQG